MQSQAARYCLLQTGSDCSVFVPVSILCWLVESVPWVSNAVFYPATPPLPNQLWVLSLCFAGSILSSQKEHLIGRMKWQGRWSGRPAFIILLHFHIRILSGSSRTFIPLSTFSFNPLFPSRFFGIVLFLSVWIANWLRISHCRFQHSCSVFRKLILAKFCHAFQLH
jgi:hypothetical protein